MLESIEDIKKTETWELYEKGRNYLQRMSVFTDTDRNYRMYNGNQWEGAKIEGIEPAQYNFIETIVNYKVSTINQREYIVHFSSENYELKSFRKNAKRLCDLLDKKAAKVWEKDQLDDKVRIISTDAAVNDEGIIYVNYNETEQSPENEIINKNNIQFGNENSDDIQSQPYIIISQRKPVPELRELAKLYGVGEDKIKYIIGDNDTIDQTGEDSKQEKDNMATLITKMWKDNGQVHYTKSVKYVELKKDINTKLTLYPVSHFIWQNKKGSSRGEGIVRNLIPNQLELNKTLTRMLLNVKQNAYNQKVVNIDKISNPDALNRVGGIIKVKGGASVEDVNKVFSYLQPASMSTDVSKVMADLISITRDLKNAGDIATGDVNPEAASGKAILAVQQASQQPMNNQMSGLKKFVEDIARIWLDMWTIYTPDGMKLEEEIKDPQTGETYTQVVNIPASMLKNLKGAVKIDITPTSPYDKYAREMSLENLLKQGYFNVQRLQELKVYAHVLPDNSVMDKMALEEAIAYMEEEQQKIAEINAQAQIMMSNANRFISEGPEAQADQLMASAQ